MQFYAILMSLVLFMMELTMMLMLNAMLNQHC